MEDEVLMWRVAEGELAYASLIFERYNILIYNYFVKNTFDKMISQDLTQNVFYRLIKYRKSYRKEYPFRSWLYRISRNVFIDYTKESKKNYTYELFEEKIDDFLELNYFEKNEETEKEQLLYKALSKMNEEERELINLSKFQQIKYREIAHIMESTESAIKVKVHRAIKKLKEIYFNMEN